MITPKSKTYSTTIDDISISLDCDFLNEYLKSEQYVEIFQKPEEQYFGLNSHQFAKYLTQYIQQNFPVHCNMSQDCINKAYQRLKKAVSIHMFKINCPHISNDHFSDKINIHPDLHKAMVSNLPTLSKDQMAIYLYIKLCYLLRYSEQFDAVGQHGKIALQHEDIQRASTVTPTNNSIVCYEFIYIYAKYLKQLGIPYLINSRNSSEYGKRHVSLTLKVDGHTVLVDPTQTIFNDDLYYVKINAPLRGLKCKDYKIKRIDAFTEFANQVYEIYKQQEPSAYCPANNPTYWIDTITSLQSKQYCFPEVKANHLAEAIKDCTLDQTEKMAMANSMLVSLFKPDIIDKNIMISYFCHNLPDGTYSTAIGLAYNKSRKSITNGYECFNNQYIVYDGQTVQHYTRDALQELFDNGKYNYIRKRQDDPDNPIVANYEQRLPGIFENFDYLEKE